MADPAQITQVITELPVAPAEGSGFRAKAAIFLAALVTFAQQLIAFRSQANAVAVETNAHALVCASNASLSHAAAADAVAALAGANNQADIATAAATTATSAAGDAVSAATASGVAKTGAEAARDIALAAAADATGIQPSIGIAKGDLIAFSATGTPVRIAAGVDGKVLKTDSTAVPGVAWGDVAGGGCPTDITNAGFVIWSNGTIESAVSSVNLINNGDEWTGVTGTETSSNTTPPTGWALYNGAQVGLGVSPHVNTGINSLLLKNGSASQSYIAQQQATISGHVYKAVMYILAGTEGGYLIAGTNATVFANSYDIAISAYVPGAAYTRVEIVFEAVGATTYIGFMHGNSSSGLITFIDSITLYDMGANLVLNGTFNSNTTGWTGSNATLASISGGLNGNCLQATLSASGYVCQQITGLTIGKLYRISAWLKTGGANPSLGVGDTPGIYPTSLTSFNSGFASLSSWTFCTGIFEATSTSTWVWLTGNATSTVLFDSITLNEVTRGCVDYNSSAPDLWNKDLSTKCWRETNQTKGGSYYALRVYGGCCYWSDGGRAAKPEFYSRYADAGAVVKGTWVKSSTPNAARIGIQDSVGKTWSAYHPGDGIYHWLKVTRSPAAGITSFQTIVDSGAGAEAIFSQPQLQPGTAIGEGCFVPRVSETILFPPITSVALPYSATSSIADKKINVSTDTLGAIGHGVKNVLCVLIGNDSGSASSGNCGICLAPKAGSGLLFTAPVGVIVNFVSPNTYLRNTGQVSPDIFGNIYVSITASGTNTFYPMLVYNGVQL